MPVELRSQTYLKHAYSQSTIKILPSFRLKLITSTHYLWKRNIFERNTRIDVYERNIQHAISCTRCTLVAICPHNIEGNVKRSDTKQVMSRDDYVAKGSGILSQKEGL
jgi:hypothetical protein